MEEILKFVSENLYVLAVVLWIIGSQLKKTPKVPDWLIPWILMACGIGLAMLMLGPGVDAVIQGVLVAGASVLGHQLVKQTMEGASGE